MYFFALLEAGVDEAIGEMLGVDELQNQILVRNIEFSRKIFILKSAFTIDGKDPDATSLLNRIAKASEIRNQVAHNMFLPDHGGIRFLTVVARSELKFPETVYTIDEFSEKI